MTMTSSTVGPLGALPLAALKAEDTLPSDPVRLPSTGVDAEPVLDPDAAFGFNVSRAWNSSPFADSDCRISTDTGRLRSGFGILPVVEEDVNISGSRLHSYPASTKRPSGGTKLSSPGCSRHRASLTQGWKHGRSIACTTPVLPPGAVSVSNRSGTPDILAVKAIVPFAMADNGLPDGAYMTESFSTMSTYSSLEVCLTFARRHGIAEPAADVGVPFCVNGDAGLPRAGVGSAGGALKIVWSVQFELSHIAQQQLTLAVQVHQANCPSVSVRLSPLSTRLVLCCIRVLHRTSRR